MPQIKTAVARKLASAHDMSIDKAKQVYDFVLTCIENEAERQTVILPGIGSIRTAKVETRTHRNPQTGEAVVVRAHKKFKLKGKKF